MLKYGIYNAETLEKLINTVQEIHNVTSSHERLFAGEHNPAIFRLLYMNALGIQQYAFNSLLFLRDVQDKYISSYKELITKLKLYVSSMRILTKGYLPYYFNYSQVNYKRSLLKLQSHYIKLTQIMP